MALAALIIGVVAWLVLALLWAMPLQLVGPLAGPLGGGLAMVALVLGASALAARRRARRRGEEASLGSAVIALLLGLTGVACAMGVEGMLIVRERRERAERDAARPAPAEKARQEKQLDDLVNDNLKR